jgi:hypothetical protein
MTLPTGFFGTMAEPRPPGIVGNLLHSKPMKREDVKVNKRKPEKLIPPQK